MASGLVGHALAVLVFLGVFLLDPEDPADRAGAAVGLSLLTGALGSAVTLGIAIRRLVRGHRDKALTGMLATWALGAVVGVVAAGIVLVRTSDWSGHCPCDPPIPLF